MEREVKRYIDPGRFTNVAEKHGYEVKFTVFNAIIDLGNGFEVYVCHRGGEIAEKDRLYIGYDSGWWEDQNSKIGGFDVDMSGESMELLTDILVESSIYDLLKKLER